LSTSIESFLTILVALAGLKGFLTFGLTEADSETEVEAEIEVEAETEAETEVETETEVEAETEAEASTEELLTITGLGVNESFALVVVDADNNKLADNRITAKIKITFFVCIN
jgi:hypothetical protein